jgi:hypothetical protein
VYAVPLEDGSFGFAQAVEAMMANIVYVALLGVRRPGRPDAVPALTPGDIVSLAATWRQDLNRGDWPQLGPAPLVVTKVDFPNERFAQARYVGAKHYDAGILADFLSAYHGLLPWNVLYEEDYYDRLLPPGVARPPNAVVLSPAERESYRLERAWASRVSKRDDG